MQRTNQCKQPRYRKWSRGDHPERQSQPTKEDVVARIKLPVLGLAVIAILVFTVCATQSQPRAQATTPPVAPQSYDALIHANANRMVEEGKQIFRFDTFGSEDFWGGKLRLHESIAGQKLGGVGGGVSPKAALALGLKVDAEALPAALFAQIKAGRVDLDDPATTLALLKLNAVLGVTGFFADDGKLRSVGIQCAICHSTVDDSFAPGIGKRLDGWGNRDLNIGAIVATAPNLQPFSETARCRRRDGQEGVERLGTGSL